VKQLAPWAAGPATNCVDVHGGGPLVWLYRCGPGLNDQFVFDEGGVLNAEGTGGTALVRVGC